MLSNAFQHISILYFALAPLSLFMPRVSTILFSTIGFFTLLYNYKQNTYKQIFEIKISFNKKYMVLLFAFLLWVLLESFFAENLSQHLTYTFKSLTLVFGIIAFFRSFELMPSEINKKCLEYAAYGALFAGAIILIDSFFDSPITKYIQHGFIERTYAKTALIISFTGLLPLFAFTGLKRIVSLLFMGIMIFFSECDTAILGFWSGLLVFFLLYFDKKYTFIKKSAYVFITVSFLFLPKCMDLFLNEVGVEYLEKTKIIKDKSSYHRIDIWKEILKTINKKPITGFGINASQNENVVGKEKTVVLKDLDHVGNDSVVRYNIHHPHNYILQLWLELGLVGILLGMALSLMIVKHFFNNKAFIVFFVCLHSHLWVSIGIWQSWWWSFVIMLYPLVKAIKDE